jgi:uncharacterized protein (DUF1697 family)
MYSHVVLLRGVNVGKAKRVPMVELAKLLRKVGCSEVATILNSGNAVVAISSTSADKLARLTADALRSALGFDVPVVVKSSRTFRMIVSGNELRSSSTNPSRLLVAFAQTSKALKALKPISAAVRPPEQFLVGAYAAYLNCPKGILESKAAESLLGRLGAGITTRNWATVLKLQELLAARAA